MATTYHSWSHRAKHTCGFLWTNPGAPNVVCKCGGLEFVDGVLNGTSESFTEEEFLNAVAADLGVAAADLTLIYEAE